MTPTIPTATIVLFGGQIELLVPDAVEQSGGALHPTTAAWVLLNVTPWLALSV